MTNPESPPVEDFPPATREDWRKLVDAVLKGAPFERLIGTTYDDLRIEPLAVRRTDVPPLAGRPGATPWQILARIDQPDPALANEAALRELENGASGLSLVFAGSAGDHGFALPADASALARVLERIEPSADVPLELDLSPHASAEIDAALAAERLPLLKTANVRLGHDPLGAMAISGGAARAWSEEAPHFARRLAALRRDGWRGRLAAADGRVVHAAGGSEAQELAFALGVALSYLRALEGEGVALETGRDMIFFRLAADAEQFLTIAKFRALRILWARVETACGLAPAPAFVSAETAWRMMAQRDPHVNILRATIAVFAAALGGADAISVIPFSAARGVPDRWARRIARNTQLILIEESHLDKVADPSAGAGAIEDLTDQLCRAAWPFFQEIEAAGGVAVALERNLVQGKVGAVHARRAAAVAHLKDALTGVSIFPDLQEEPFTPPPPAPRSDAQRSFEPLLPLRLAQPFERLRNVSDEILARTGARPRIFLATLGAPADFTARATFAKNFFEAGGFETVTEDNADFFAADAARDLRGATLACLCSSDKVYERNAVPAAQALKASGARHIYLAGRPGEREAALRAAGVQSFIYEGCDALATLEAAYDILGISAGVRSGAASG